MTHVALTSALLPLIATLAAAREPQQSPPSDGTIAQVAIGDFERAQVFFQETEDAIWARGRSYKASATSAGFTYIPFLGSAAERTWPVRFSLSSVTLGGEELALGRAQPRRDEQHIVLDRASVSVHYDLDLESVEQSFALDGIAGRDAELVLRLAISTDLNLQIEGRAITFRGPVGGVSFGAAAVFDSAGRSLAVNTSWEGGELVFRVPSAFVAAAEGTVVVDPLIATVTIDDFNADLKNPDVAFEEDGNTYCVVYEESFSSNDTDVYWRTLDATTLMLVDEGYISMTAAHARRPKIASLAQNNSFLVVYKLGNALGRPELFARKRDSAATSTWGPDVLITGFSQVFNPTNHDVGGEAFEAIGVTNYLVVWEMRSVPLGALPSRVEGTLVGGDGLPVGSVIQITSGSANTNELPSVSKSSGDPNLHGAWWVTYKSNNATGTRSAIRGARIRFDGTVTDPDAELFHDPSIRVLFTEVSAPYQGGYDESIHVAFDDFNGGVFVGHLLTLALTPSGLISTEAAIDVIDSSAPLSGFAGAFATLSDRAAHFHDIRDSLPMQSGLVVSTLEFVLGEAVAVGERRTEFGQVAISHGAQLDATSRAAGGDLTSRQAFAVWSALSTTSADTNIYGALLEFPEPPAIGGNICRGHPNSTGDYSYLTAFGDNSPTAAKSLRVTNLPPNAAGYFLASLSSGSTNFPGGSSGLLCVSGSIGRYAGSVLNSGSSGQFDFVVDPTSIPQPTGSVPAMIGDRWYFQAWHRDANPSSTSNFTNAILIGF